MEQYINKIIQGDCLEKLKELSENSVDSIVTDPPYELGFMGKSWDNTGIANNKEMWAECLRVLKPGGHLLAFSGTRTYHRMTVAIEDAGFEVRDMIEWVYGSGFPKSLNVGKKVDELQGNERTPYERPDFVARSNKTEQRKSQVICGEKGKYTKGTSEWEGWGTALKPAHEPICMARKPLAEKTVAENCLKWGTGGINIDESRVEAKPRKTGTKPTSDEATGSGNTLQGSSKNRQAEYDEQNLGRFPANLIHDNSEEVRECFPETKSGGGNKGNVKEGTGMFGNGKAFDTPTVEVDSGNASRFFKSIVYVPKASKSERNKGCEGLEEKETKRYGDFEGTEEHAPKLNVKNTNNHPTVKPIALMEYLIKMVTPKGGIVLDPFAGSGSTLVAAKQNGFQFIGIELTEEYIPIIEARLSAEKQTLF